jgi:GNAT superfamily N-acetyltransferase
MIRFATKDMIPELKLIWKESFHDDDAYIDFYYENRFKGENTLVWLENERAVSMLTLMPAFLHESSGRKKVFYIYAVSTLPSYRGKGISSLLLQHANRITDGMTILVPATESLFNFYERNGYQPNFSRKVVNLVVHEEVDRFVSKRANMEGLLKVSEYKENQNDESVFGIDIEEIKPSDASKYKLLRDQAFGGEGYIEWDEPSVAYSIMENTFTGGFTHLIDGKYIAMSRPFEGTLFIRETTLPSNYLKVYADTMVKRLSCKKIEIYLPSFSELPGRNERFAMSCNLIGNQSSYFNLVLD